MSAILPDVISTVFGQAARIALVRNILPGYFARGLSVNAIQKLLPPLGLGLRRQVLQGLARVALKTVVSQDYVKHVGKSKRLDPFKLVGRKIESGAGFQYVVEIIGHSTVTGLETVITRTAESDSLLTRSQAADLMIAEMAKHEARYNLSIDSANTVEAWKNRDMVIDRIVNDEVVYSLGAEGE